MEAGSITKTSGIKSLKSALDRRFHTMFGERWILFKGLQKCQSRIWSATQGVNNVSEYKPSVIDCEHHIRHQELAVDPSVLGVSILSVSHCRNRGW